MFMVGKIRRMHFRDGNPPQGDPGAESPQLANGYLITNLTFGFAS